jgi:hypothetical protein
VLRESKPLKKFVNCVALQRAKIPRIDRCPLSEGLPIPEGGRIVTTPRLLYDRKSAAQMLSISVRSLDSFIARKAIQFRRIGRRVLIPHGELMKFARADHFEIA